MSRRSSVASPIYEKCRPRNNGKTKKNVDLIQDLTKTFIYVYCKPPRFMKENYLLSLYIPAGCTDVVQTCDTVANKPFKVGIKPVSGIIYSKNMSNGLLLILTARQEGSGIRSSLWVLSKKRSPVLSQ